MSEGIVIRPYTANDEAGLLSAWNEVMWTDPLNEFRWRSTYLLDPNFSPESCLVAVDPVSGAIIGYVLGFADTRGDSHDAWIVGFGVRAVHRRKGIGTALLTTLKERFRTNGVTKIHVGPYIPSYLTPGVDIAAYADALPFLASLGAVEGARPVSMKASLTNYVVRPSVGPLTDTLGSAGIEVREATGANILPLLAFMEEHFAHWVPDARRALGAIVRGEADTATLHVATDNGKIIGYAQTQSERFGPFGVNEAYRGRGIGAVLLSRALMAMRSQGYHSAWFLWTSDRTAKLYGEHGFEEVRRFAMVDMPL
jgi:GNAT superfamily N-acetyltransferase